MYCFFAIFEVLERTNDQTNTTMRLPNEKKATGEKITFENGKSFSIYSSMTKKGVRFYYWSFGRFLPISKFDINKYITL